MLFSRGAHRRGEKCTCRPIDITMYDAKMQNPVAFVCFCWLVIRTNNCFTLSLELLQFKLIGCFHSAVFVKPAMCGYHSYSATSQRLLLPSFIVACTHSLLACSANNHKGCLRRDTDYCFGCGSSPPFALACITHTYNVLLV